MKEMIVAALLAAALTIGAACIAEDVRAYTDCDTTCYTNPITGDTRCTTTCYEWGN